MLTLISSRLHTHILFPLLVAFLFSNYVPLKGNMPPVAVGDSFNVHSSTGLNIIVNDYDPDGDGFTAHEIVAGPAHGTLSVISIGLFTYAPQYGYTGADSFTYKLFDGIAWSNVATVTLSVNNQGPAAGSDFCNIHGSGWTGSLTSNDYDSDGDQLDLNSLEFLALPAHGAITSSQHPANYGYVPVFSYVGSDSFTYRIKDHLGAWSNAATVTISVVNQPPIAVDDSYVLHGAGWTGPLTSNDVDPDGDQFEFNSLEIVTSPTHGSITSIMAPAKVHYTGSAGYTGSDSYTYRIKDHLGLFSNTATVYLFVIGTDGAENAGEASCHAVGQPVNVTNGNMYVHQTDYRLPGAGEAINVTRTYNSIVQNIGLFGLGWSTAYDESIWIYDNNLVRLNLPDGRAIYVGRTNGTGAFTPRTPSFYGQLVKNTNNSFTLTYKDGRVHQFNASGRLVSQTDRYNNQTLLTYDSNGRLSTLTDPFGRVVTVTTDSYGRVLSFSDTLGTIATYIYGTSSELTSVTYADNSKYQFAYTAIGGKLLLTTVTDALGNVVEAHAYDSLGRATTSERHGGVERYTLNYVDNTETDVTDALGHVTKYFLDKSNGRNVVTSVEGICSCGDAQTQSWTYDAQLNVTSKTNALNQTTTFTYDVNGNRLTMTNALGTTSYTYNGFGQVSTMTDVMSGVTTNTYSSAGNLLTSKDALDNTTTLTYDTRGRPLTVTDARGKVTTFTYTSGNLTRRTDALNNQTNLGYDARGRLTSMTDALNQTTSYGYDAAGRINRVTYPGSSFITFAYDLAGRRTSFTDARNYTTTYAYDNAYRLTSETNAASQVLSYGYNLMSLLTSRTDAVGRVTNYEYDDFNRLKKTIYPAATAGATRLEERIEYDANGNIKKRVDTAGRETLFDYDTSNRLYRVTDPSLQITQMGYNGRSETTSLTDALNQTYTFAYDAVGRMTQTTRASNTMNFEYDAVGNRTKRTDFNGSVSSYTYDDLNRLTHIAYKNDPNQGDNPTAPGTSYTYDALSRLLTAANESGTVTIGYDNRNRASSVTDVTGQTVTYGYDSNGNRTTMNLGQTISATYSYDAVSRLTQLTDNVGAIFGFGYDATNKLSSRTLPNSITSTYEYDGLDRLTRLKHVGSASTLADYQYQFNTASQITQVAEPTTTRNYGYDVVDRLTSATQTGQPSESYVYDGVGNRTASHRSPSYGYQPYNKLITTSTASYVYDSNGNMLRKTDSAGTWQYYWNAENQLVRVVKPGTGPLSYRTINYKYDALGRRVERQMKRGGTTAFTYDGQDVILDQKSDGTTTTYVNGPGIDNKLKQTSSVTGTHYYLQDHLGSTTALTNSSGNVSAQISYDAYGNSTSNALTRYGYTGRELDADTGLMYYRARWYDSQLGRFMSEDPIGFAGSDVNLYNYVASNPVSWKDPLGQDLFGVIGGASGGAAVGGLGILGTGSYMIGINDECGCKDYSSMGGAGSFGFSAGEDYGYPEKHGPGGGLGAMIGAGGGFFWSNSKSFGELVGTFETTIISTPFGVAIEIDKSGDNKIISLAFGKGWGAGVFHLTTNTPEWSAWEGKCASPEQLYGPGTPGSFVP